MKGCRNAFAGLLLLIVGFGACTFFADQNAEENRIANKEAEEKEEARRATITPEERAAEDVAKAEKEARERERQDELEQEQAAKDAEQEKLGEWNNRRSEAYGISKDYVKQFLNFPQDASFPWVDFEIRASEQNYVFWVLSTVKAKNAFGAELTYPWKTCVIFRENKWHLDYCELNGDVVYLSPKATNALSNLAKTLEETEKQSKASSAKRRQEEALARKQEVKATKRETNLARTAKIKKAAKQNRDTIAQNTLRLGKQLEKSGKPLAARSWYSKVAKRYPETTAASEARDLLGLPDIEPSVSESGEKMRAWKDRSGKHTTKATFVSLEGTVVTLRNENNRIVRAPLSKLSEEDQQYIRDQADLP